jgi:hypothetical protein
MMVFYIRRFFFRQFLSASCFVAPYSSRQFLTGRDAVEDHKLVMDDGPVTNSALSIILPN